MIDSNIYFRGFVFNDKFNQTNIDKEKANEYINDIFNFDVITNEKIIKNIKFIDSYNNFYFRTELINDSILSDVYRSIMFDNNIIRKNVYIYHFFKIKKDCNYIKLYKIISNIENMQRLIIAFIYYLIKKIKLSRIEKKDFIVSDDIDSYTSFFLNIDKEQINIKELINWYQKNETNNIKDLYVEVAKIYNVSPKTIKWSIRTSIDTLNRSVSIDTLCSVFSLKFRPETVIIIY